MYAQIGLLVCVGAVSSLPRPQQGFVILEAETISGNTDSLGGEDRQRDGRLLVDNTPPGKAGFRAPLPGLVDDNLGAVIVEVDKFDDSNSEGFEDIPRDRSAPDQAGFRLPLPQASDAIVFEADGLAEPRRAQQQNQQDFVVVEADNSKEGRAFVADIPRDRSGLKVAGFRLPLPDKSTEVEADNGDFVVVEADNTEEGRALAADIPRDQSGLKAASFRLPLPDVSTEEGEDNADFVVVEADDSKEGRALVADIPRDRSGLKVAGFRLPLPDPSINADVGAVIVETQTGDGRSLLLEDVPRNTAGLKVAAFRLPLSSEVEDVEEQRRVPRDEPSNLER